MASGERIGFTAHYTSYVWYRAGLSPRALTSGLGCALHLALRPMNLWYERLGRGSSLDQMLLARHRTLDDLLEREVRAGRVRQVVEFGAGLSPRGLAFATRHPLLVYVEVELPAMAE